MKINKSFLNDNTVMLCCHFWSCKLKSLFFNHQHIEAIVFADAFMPTKCTDTSP